jgi:predicted HTH transcriptional regulator
MQETKAEIGSLPTEKEKDVQSKLQELAEEEKRLHALSQQIDAERQKYEQAAADKIKQLSEYKIQLSEKETSLGEMQQQLQTQKRDLEAFVEQKNKELDEREKKTQAQAKSEPPPEQAHEPIVPIAAELNVPSRAAEVLPRESAGANAQELNPRQRALIDKLKTTERITRKEYSDMLNISTPTAARDLKELLDRKILVAKGPLGPGRWYELNK